MTIYDQWRLATPPYWCHPPEFRCDECGEWWEDCQCEDGPVEPEPYSREDYEADRADDLYYERERP